MSVLFRVINKNTGEDWLPANQRETIVIDKVGNLAILRLSICGPEIEKLSRSEWDVVFTNSSQRCVIDDYNPMENFKKYLELAVEALYEANLSTRGDVLTLNIIDLNNGANK